MKSKQVIKILKHHIIILQNTVTLYFIYLIVVLNGLKLTFILGYYY